MFLNYYIICYTHALLVCPLTGDGRLYMGWALVVVKDAPDQADFMILALGFTPSTCRLLKWGMGYTNKSNNRH